ncbi:MAG TPA: type II secretion system protein GspM [Rhizomicrobium sp.]|nr:type II secretion system protein GspM [Rhizomicrobium sp.]
MKPLPGGFAGQMLALAIALAGAAGFYLLLISPVLGVYGARAELLERRMALAQRYEALAYELPTLREADKKWRDRSGGELLLAGNSDALAAAALQTEMKGLVEDAGAKLTSSEVLDSAAEGNFRRVGVRVVFSGDLKLITEVLRGLETSRPVLSVEDFSFHAGLGAAADDSEEDSDTGGDGTLAVTLDVYGFRAV